jgi:H+/Cl- antiporter ClcA
MVAGTAAGAVGVAGRAGNPAFAGYRRAPPADGFKPGGALPLEQIPDVVLAAVATLSFGVVLGPEAPLILLGSGLGVLAVRLAARDAPDKATAVIAAAGSFAAISSLLGSPLVGAFLLLEASGLGGPMLGLVLVPGLLAAFVGLDNLTGFGTFSLAIPGVPPFDRPTLALSGWAIVFGPLAPILGRGIQTARCRGPRARRAQDGPADARRSASASSRHTVHPVAGGRAYCVARRMRR